MVMKRYPNGAAGEVLLHEARARRRVRTGSRPARSSTHREASSTFRWSRTSRRCSGWSTSAASTSTSGTRAATTSIVPTTCTSTSTPCRARASRACARPRCSCARRSRRSACACSRRPRARAASTSTCRSCAGRAEAGVDVRQGVRARAGSARAEAHHRGVPHRASARADACSWTTTRTRGDARSRRSTRCARTPRAAVSTPVTWEEVERGVDDRRLPHRQRSRARRRSSAISGSRCSPRAGASSSRALL